MGGKRDIDIDPDFSSDASGASSPVNHQVSIPGEISVATRIEDCYGGIVILDFSIGLSVGPTAHSLLGLYHCHQFSVHLRRQKVCFPLVLICIRGSSIPY